MWRMGHRPPGPTGLRLYGDPSNPLGLVPRGQMLIFLAFADSDRGAGDGRRTSDQGLAPAPSARKLNSCYLTEFHGLRLLRLFVCNRCGLLPYQSQGRFVWLTAQPACGTGVFD